MESITFELYITAEIDVEKLASQCHIGIAVDPTKTADFGDGTEFYYTLTGTYEDIRDFLEAIEATSDVVRLDYYCQGR